MPALSGCFTAAYVGGTIAHATDPTFRKAGVLVLAVREDGGLTTLRLPVSCRSFVHPMSGTRVTRDGGEVFRINSSADEVRLLSISYSCDEKDAKISLDPADVMFMYTIRRGFPATVTEDMVLPSSSALASSARVVRTNIDSDRADSPTNAIAVGSVVDEANRFTDNLEVRRPFLAVERSTVNLPSPYISKDDVAALDGESIDPVSPVLSRRIRASFPRRPFRLKEADPWIPVALDSIPFALDPGDKVFKPKPQQRGRRIYTKVEDPQCPSHALECLSSRLKASDEGQLTSLESIAYDRRAKKLSLMRSAWFN